MPKKTWPELLSVAVKETVGEDIEEEVMSGCQGLTTLEEKACWSRQAMERLDRLVPDASSRKDIMRQCACECFPAEQIAKLRAVYERARDVDELLEAMYQNPFYVRPRREGNTIFFTKAPHDAEQYEAATTPEEKRRHYCHCEYAKGTTGERSKTHCLCGAAWYQKIMEGILGKPVTIDIEKSVMLGDDACVIRLEF